APEPLLGRVDRPRFGDVAERPPIFSQDALKSGAKGKQKSGEGAGKQGVLGASNLSDYVGQVRDAYETMTPGFVKGSWGFRTESTLGRFWVQRCSWELH
ncbi:unnamed protein product, partial [Symbiodinium pilosum]